MERQGLPVPPAFALIARAVVTLEGSCAASIRRSASRGRRQSTSLHTCSRPRATRPSWHGASCSRPAVPAGAARARRGHRLQLRSGLVRLEVETLTPARRTALTRWVDQVLFVRSRVGRPARLRAVLRRCGPGRWRQSHYDPHRDRIDRHRPLVRDAPARRRADRPAPVRCDRVMTVSPPSGCKDVVTSAGGTAWISC